MLTSTCSNCFVFFFTPLEFGVASVPTTAESELGFDRQLAGERRRFYNISVAAVLWTSVVLFRRLLSTLIDSQMRREPLLWFFWRRTEQRLWGPAAIPAGTHSGMTPFGWKEWRNYCYYNVKSRILNRLAWCIKKGRNDMTWNRK